MISQELVKEVAVLSSSGASAERLGHISTTAQELGQGLRALQHGGQITYAGETVPVPRPTDPEVQNLLRQARSTWGETQATLDTLLTATPGTPAYTTALGKLDGQAQSLLLQFDRVTIRFQHIAEARVTRLHMVQVSTLVLAGLVLTLGYFLTVHSVLRPLRLMQGSVRRLQAQDLATPVPLLGPSHRKMPAVLSQLRVATEADGCVLRTPDGDGNLQVTAVDPEDGDLRPSPVLPPGGRGGLSGLAYAEGRSVAAGDYPSDPHADPELAAQGVEAALAVPILVEGEPRGVISLISREADHFTEERRHLARGLADHLGALLQTVYLSSALESELEQSRRRLEAFQAAARRLALEEDPGLAAQHLVDSVRDLVGARYAALAVWGPGGATRR